MIISGKSLNSVTNTTTEHLTDTTMICDVTDFGFVLFRDGTVVGLVIVIQGSVFWVFGVALQK